jgi:hypothetical protein
VVSNVTAGLSLQGVPDHFARQLPSHAKKERLVVAFAAG